MMKEGNMEKYQENQDIIDKQINDLTKVVNKVTTETSVPTMQ